MKAAVFERPGLMSVREVDDPVCDPEGILVRVIACGLCGSDVRNFRVGLRSGKTGQVMGHEIAGAVAAVGERCDRFSVGERVAVAPDVSCGTCFYCARGLVNLCLDHRMLGTHWPGGFAQFLSLPAEVLRRGMICRMPPGVGHGEAALAEPLASVLAAQDAAGVGSGVSVAIFGDGPAGCMHVEVARRRGAGPVLLVGRRRLGLASVFEPDHLLSSEEAPAEAIRGLTAGIGVDVAIIATPAAQSQALGIAAVRKRGIVVLFGGLPRGSPYASFDSNRIHYDELRVQGSFSYTTDGFRRALEEIGHGLITPGLYISRVVGLEGIPDGIVASERGEVLKVLVDPWAGSGSQIRDKPWAGSLSQIRDRSRPGGGGQ